MFLTVKLFWKIIEKLELKILLFSSFPDTTYPGFAGKWTEKIWWPSTGLGCCTPREGLWNFYWKTSPRPFWGWTYTIMWKSECKFKFPYLFLREKYYSFHFAFTLILLGQWWFLFQLLFPKQFVLSYLLVTIPLLSWLSLSSLSYHRPRDISCYRHHCWWLSNLCLNPWSQLAHHLTTNSACLSK